MDEILNRVLELQQKLRHEASEVKLKDGKGFVFPAAKAKIEVLNEIADRLELVAYGPETKGEVKITNGTILIATDECKMNKGNEPALQVGKEYPVLTTDDLRMEFSVESSIFPHHFFSTQEGNEAHWRHFFKLKE